MPFEMNFTAPLRAPRDAPESASHHEGLLLDSSWMFHFLAELVPVMVNCINQQVFFPLLLFIGARAGHLVSPARPGGRQCQWFGLRPAAQGSRREAGFPCAMCKWNQSCGQRALNPTWEGQPSPRNAPSPVMPSPAHPTGTRLLSLVPLGDARNLKGAVITGGV